MKVYNEDKTIELNEYDLERGYLTPSTILKEHHEAVEEVQKVSHYETVAEYENGGKDVEEVIDVPYTPYQPDWDEFEDIQIYIPYTPKELAEIEISQLKGQLMDTDYKAIKFAEGMMTAEEYEPTKLQRQTWRDRINELEEIIND